MPIKVPNYRPKTDRLQFGTLIGIPGNPHQRLLQGRLRINEALVYVKALQ